MTSSTVRLRALSAAVAALALAGCSGGSSGSSSTTTTSGAGGASGTTAATTASSTAASSASGSSGGRSGSSSGSNGASSSGGTSAATTGGSIGGSSGSSGASSGSSGSTGADAIALADLCVTAARGGFNYVKGTEAACSQPITDADVPHLSSVGGQSGAFMLDFMRCDGLLGQLTTNVTASVQASRLSFDGVKAKQCQTLGRTLLAGADGGFNGDGGNPCDGIFTPNVATGDACAHSYECKAGDYCKPADGIGQVSCAGLCATLSHAGEPCGDNLLCDDQSTCTAPARDAGPTADGGSAGYTCVALNQRGQRCSEDGDCAAPLSCAGNGTCQSAVGLGEACGAAAPCSEGTCIGGVCTPDSEPGQPCSPSEEDPNTGDLIPLGAAPSCASCLRCSGAVATAIDGGGDAGLVGSCESFGALGATCASAADCQDLYECVAGDGGRTCQFLPRTGEACRVTTGGAAQDTGNCLYIDDFCQRTGSTQRVGVCARNATGHGQACADDAFGLPSGCSESSDYCAASTGDGGKVCDTLPGKDQPCTGACNGNLDCFFTALDGGFADGGTFTDGGARPPRPVVLDGGGLCRDLPGVGQACDPDGSGCASGLYCDDTLLTCATLLADGAACVSDGQCVTGKCGTQSQTCIHDCVPDVESCSNCTGGLGWLTQFIFLSLALHLGGKRRSQR